MRRPIKEIMFILIATVLIIMSSLFFRFSTNMGILKLTMDVNELKTEMEVEDEKDDIKDFIKDFFDKIF